MIDPSPIDERFDERELEKRDAALLEGLRTSLAREEIRLYRSGKHEGLFHSKSGFHAEAAELALREGLLEHTQTEKSGRFEYELVRITPKGVEYLYQHDSPRAVLGELRGMLHSARLGIPIWQDAMLASLEKLASDITGEMGRYLQRLDGLTLRVEEALKRIEVSPSLSPNVQALVPWGVDALTYLDRRIQGGATDDCPMPELFGAIHGKHGYLTLRDFYDGLRRLADNRAVRLSPYSGPGPIPQPEFALMEDGRLMYLVAR
jgi:hypothetical protein